MISHNFYSLDFKTNESFCIIGGKSEGRKNENFQLQVKILHCLIRSDIGKQKLSTKATENI